MTVYWEMEQQSVRTCSYVTGRRRKFYLLLMPETSRLRQRTVGTDRVFKTFICEIGIYGEISGHHTGVGQRFGIDE